MPLVLLSYPFFFLFICTTRLPFRLPSMSRAKRCCCYLQSFYYISFVFPFSDKHLKCLFIPICCQVAATAIAVVGIVVVTAGCCCPTGRVFATKWIPMNVEEPPPETPQSVATSDVQRATNGQQCQCHCHRGARLVLLLSLPPRPPTHSMLPSKAGCLCRLGDVATQFIAHCRYERSNLEKVGHDLCE